MNKENKTYNTKSRIFNTDRFDLHDKLYIKNYYITKDIEVYASIKINNIPVTISNHGNVLQSLNTKLLNNSNIHKHKIVSIFDGKTYTTETLHKLVYIIFIGNILKGNHIHHIDFNPINNNIFNLEQLTPQEHSIKHSISGERYIRARKTRGHMKYSIIIDGILHEHIWNNLTLAIQTRNRILNITRHII